MARPPVFTSPRGLSNSTLIATLLCMIAVSAPPYPAGQKEALLLLFLAAALIDPVLKRGSSSLAGTGWPALALAMGAPGPGAAWLVTALLLLRALLDALLKRSVPLRAMGEALPVVASLAVCRLVPPSFALIALALAFIGLNIALGVGKFRAACEELLWAGLLVAAWPHGTWILLLAAVTLVAAFSQGEVQADDRLQQALSRQMSATETTLRASQRKFRQDRGKFHGFLSLQGALDDFQGHALRAESPGAVAELLIATVEKMDEQARAAVCAAHSDGLALLAGSRDFLLDEFLPLPQGWRAGQMIRSADGRRGFYGLASELVFLVEIEPEAKDLLEEFLEHLLARARLILRILEQRRDLATLLTEKSAALDRLAESQNQLLQAEKLAAVGRLAAGVAHEINSPLAAIHLQLGMARRRLAKDDLEGVTRSLETSQQASLRAKAIIEGLMTYSRFSDGARGPTDLAAVVKETVQILEGPIEACGVDVRLQIDTLDPVVANAQEIGQILTNIIGNAIDALKAKQTERRLLITGSNAAGGQQIVVANNGPPISEDALARLFDPFFTTKDIGSGTGLGLSIAHELAKGHGGDIEAVNRDGWVRFRLWLPTAPAEETA